MLLFRLREAASIENFGTELFRRLISVRNAVAGLLIATASSAQATPSLLVDAGSLQVLRSKDAGRAWYPASTTKLMTAFVAFEQLRAGRIALQHDIAFSRQALARESVQSGLAPGSVMSLEDALYAMLAVSANEAAAAIAETLAGNEADFVAMMNDAARRLGMTGTHFVNPDGLFDRRQVTTARDLALLGVAIDRSFPEYLRFFDRSEVSIDGRLLKSSDEVIRRFPGAIGLKTGFVCASGRNLVSLAVRGERRLVAVVLGATTEKERSERIAQLLQFGFEKPDAGNRPALRTLQNQKASKPEDLRTRLCGPQAAAYERRQRKLYPMGHAGQASFLGALTAPKTWKIRTRSASVVTSSSSPSPAPRPSALRAQ
ncbi:D-alanyl-D-alanine carboxypeptidase family protein [Bosea sp. WAO]|uniref:D-alanyl-D-alanine carboxypeptidase family protein n=1 Tax=Bosea sp. WAO TaxID=406341 RepID=UPI000831A528|nr:D-alanyl-D-alanine carboxypeptidase family protein [Bosea sp. WAO]